ncbi:hypothetical protein LINPERHAP2_LOCUS27878 [Linum perenne]
MLWESAPPELVTLNSDGSVPETGQAAAGGLLKDHFGRCLAAFTINLGNCSITRGELRGVVSGFVVGLGPGLPQKRFDLGCLGFVLQIPWIWDCTSFGDGNFLDLEEIAQDCGVCAGGEETVQHLFVECELADECWRAACLQRIVEASIESYRSVGEWLLWIISTNSGEVVQKVLTILWAIWKGRNARVWNDKRTVAQWVVRDALLELCEWRAARDRHGQPNLQPTIQCRLWHLPNGTTRTCNVDAAIFADAGRTGAGMAIRDGGGQVLHFRTSSWNGCWSSTEAECKAQLEALSWTEELRIERVVFQSDAKQVVNAINKRLQPRAELGDMVGSCLAILTRNP